MTIQPIGSAGVALYLTPADLREHGLTPAGLTLERAADLARSAFRQSGMEPEGPLEIEAYPGACGVLVFARVHMPPRAWFSFGSLAAAAAAARTLPAPPPDAALLWWDGRWWLSLAAEERGAAARLSEFGRCETARPWLEASLAEHGRPVWERDALARLLTYFPA